MAITVVTQKVKAKNIQGDVTVLQEGEEGYEKPSVEKTEEHSLSGSDSSGDIQLIARKVAEFNLKQKNIAKKIHRNTKDAFNIIQQMIENK